ncbi:hypothetical protein [Nannocystis sp.]|uniref:hypothetical protein n=1 Tax=Nannocystis sp. TaxID=1962667 RepID=UPI0025D666BE|nr:hypothetical protein [Nannocystis sp.]MBK7828922.1 hypothetical protein [Nannocystis sp.]
MRSVSAAQARDWASTEAVAAGVQVGVAAVRQELQELAQVGLGVAQQRGVLDRAAELAELGEDIGGDVEAVEPARTEEATPAREGVREIHGDVLA